MRRLVPGIWLLILFIILSPYSGAQQHTFKNFTVNDGLIPTSVKRVFQDAKGFIWLCTWDGLRKYDGLNFTNFSAEQGLANNLINDICESENGRLFVATNGGGIDEIGENKVIRTAASAHIVVNQFLPGPGGKVIVTTDNNGLQEFNGSHLFKPVQSFPSRSYFDIKWLNDSLFIVAADSSINIFKKNYELFAALDLPQKELTECKFFIDSKKRVWAGNYRGVKLLNISYQNNKSPEFVSLPASFNIPVLQNSKVNDIFEDSTGTFWFATNDGIVRIYPDGSNEVIRGSDGLVSGLVNHIFTDKEKNIWFGTGLGLSRLITRSAIRIYTQQQGLPSNTIYFVEPVKKDLVLVAHSAGVQLFNKRTRKFIPVLHQQPYTSRFLSPDKKSVFLFNSNNVELFDNSTLNFNPGKKLEFGGVNVYDGIIDNNNQFFGNLNGQIYYIPAKPGKPVRVIEQLAYCLMVDRDNHLWIGTRDKGLYRIKYTVNGKTFTLLEQQHLLEKEHIRSLFQDSQNNIWAGTRQHGVYRIHAQANAPVLHFDQGKGLNSNWTKAITEDKKGNIWLVSFQGLDKLVKQRDTYRVFNFSKLNDYFSANINSIAIDNENTLWLAALEGMVQIRDGEMENIPALPVYITGINSPDSVFSPGLRHLNLKHRQNSLQFRFSSPGFINEKQMEYSYRLLGSTDEEWSAPTNQRNVTFANLGHGNYAFEVRNKGWNGEWGAASVFGFSILPPFWQTWWFRLLVFVILLAIILWGVKARIKTIRREAEMKQKISETEMNALRAQMNPHFIFNSLTSIENFIMENEKRLASDYLHKFSRLIRGMLDSSRNEVIPFDKDMELLQLYIDLEKLRFNNKFTTRVEIDPELLRGDYKVPSLLIQPYLENAIVHGIAHSKKEDLSLTVKVQVSGGKICYTIEDDGVGRQKAAFYNERNKPNHTSVGLKITEDRIHLFNQEKKLANGAVVITDLFDEMNRPAGTRVKVTIAAN